MKNKSKVLRRMGLDGLIVRDLSKGRLVKICPYCYEDGDHTLCYGPIFPIQINRDEHRSEDHYQRAVEATSEEVEKSRKCDRCGKELERLDEDVDEWKGDLS